MHDWESWPTYGGSANITWSSYPSIVGKCCTASSGQGWRDSAGTVPAARDRIAEGHSMPDHIHMCLSIPPKFSVAPHVGVLEGQECRADSSGLLHERRMTGLSFWVHRVLCQHGRPRRGAESGSTSANSEKLETGQGDLDLK